MRISVLLPFDGAALHYKNWAFDEINVDFENDIQGAKRCTLSYACAELCTYLSKLGFDVGVGLTDADFVIDLKCLDEDSEEFEIRKTNLGVEIFAKGRRGALYAVYEILEAQGIRWYSPNEEYIPKRVNELKIPECRVYKYDMPQGRGFHFEGQLKESESFLIWMARNRLSLSTIHPRSVKLQQKLGMIFKIGGHIFEKILHPYNICEDGRCFIDAHKEWYGKREEEINAENALMAQFCVCNKDVLELLSEEVIRKLNNEWKGTDKIELAGFDTWGKSCGCDECRKIGNGSDIVLYFLSHIRERINKALVNGEISKNVRIIMCVYEGTNTIEAPINPVPQNLLELDSIVFYPILRCYEHNFDDEKCDKNRMYNENLKNWLKTGINVYVCEYYNVSKFEDLPLLFTKRIENDIPYYIKSGVKEISYMHVPMVEWGVRTLNQYLFASLARNSAADVGIIKNEYFKNLYRNYADKVKEAYCLIEEALQSCSKWRAWDSKSILSNLLLWKPQEDNFSLKIGYHTGDCIVEGNEITLKLSKALKMLKDIKNLIIKEAQPDEIVNQSIVTGKVVALNPVKTKVTAESVILLDRISQDIRGIDYGADVFFLMTLILEYYQKAYVENKCADDILEKLEVLGDKMSGYCPGIRFECYRADMSVVDALERSGLKELYYKLIMLKR